MSTNPTRVMIYIVIMSGIACFIAYLNPFYSYMVDQVWLVAPAVIGFYIMCCFWMSEGHRWAYSLTSHQSHSSTAEGKPAFEIPAKNGYPVMVGFAKGGTRLYNFYSFGGKKDGFLIVPKYQVININGHRMVNTVTRSIFHTSLPPHIKTHLENDRRFSDKGMVEFGVIPYLKNIRGDFFDILDAPDQALLLDQAYETISNLKKENAANEEVIKGLTGVIHGIGESLRDVPSDKLQERVRMYAGGREDER